ncbi:HD domain-containing phosphohydrolase [Pseudobutyrivibrio sp.]|uniref:HD domain-containing phosphohydrolase n=1 Tax=Pseudobutyrivibrio sp. TaxID=2014367 RepID=UPI001DDCBED9|nr:HD domain-containing phosphohydrolase [Pseudobutyrivibrio sp.]MBE5912375.1 HD domain-containing protein [Pseudobutyrivibrio sp.]
MFDLIREHQINIMQMLCAVCGMMSILLLFARYLSTKRRWILIAMELTATFLLAFDRYAYMFKGDVSPLGYVMVRLSNFMVFFLTSMVVFVFNFYLKDLLRESQYVEELPFRLKAVDVYSIMGMILAVIAHFTNLYYYFDENNVYHRGPGFLVAYIIPVTVPIIQFTVIQHYRRAFSKVIYVSLILYIFVPIVMGIIQIFTYGISIVNMAMVMVSISLYMFAYVDLNNRIDKTRELELANLEKEQKSMKSLFDQTATAFVTAVEKRDKYNAGHALRVAELAKKIAITAGKNEKECEEVYYTALLHDVGMIGFSDETIANLDDFNDVESEEMKQKPLLSEEILSNIKAFPYLSKNSRNTCERYNGTGYPDGLKGKKIPEVCRIVAVADAYDNMVTSKKSREPLSYNWVREALLKDAGEKFDPKYAALMVHILDIEHTYEEKYVNAPIEQEIICIDYKDEVSKGITMENTFTRITFDCQPGKIGGKFGGPSLILFDSYDRRVHLKPNAIEAYSYREFAEMWFDGHIVTTAARNTKTDVSENHGKPGKYEVLTGRYEDHVFIKMISEKKVVDVTVALPNKTFAAYLGVTGEACHIKNISVEPTGRIVQEGDIERIVNETNYINRLESDLPNVQIDMHRSAYTEPLLLKDEITLRFHTMSLPSANLVWHCPYVVIYYADDKQHRGLGYKEYGLIKFNGEGTGDERYAENNFFMKKEEKFPGWDVWKQTNKNGMECTVTIKRTGNKIVTTTENLGINIKNTTIIKDKTKEVYVVLTGDQIALTDIRIR